MRYDGEGTFHMHSPTGWTIEEITSQLNQLDWTDGLAIYQSRVVSLSSLECGTSPIGGMCYPEAQSLFVEKRVENRSSFGYNWTHPTSPLSNPFRYFEADEAGSDPGGPNSANAVSLKNYPPGGFISLIIPFLSTTYLSDERGTYNQVSDFRVHRATSVNQKTPKYFCVRLVWNGDFIHQLCDPNDSQTGRTTGLVRAAIEEFWNDLKRAHYIDFATRALVITIPFSSHNAGVRSRVSFMFEFTSTGSVLPSFDTQMRVTRAANIQSTEFYSGIAFYFTLFFCAMELIEMMSSGLAYFSDLWNVMDWVNCNQHHLAHL